MNQEFNSVEDFASDEGFQDYILHSPNANNKKWNNYLAKHPDKVEMFEEAKFLVLMLSPQEKSVGKIIKPSVTSLYSHALKFAGVAAIFVLAFTCYSLLFSNASSFDFVEKHASDQNVSVLLSDLSKLDLREGSSIRFLESWEDSDKREIWLEGEAYFEVEKLPNQKPFEVHTANGTIEVLGTKFLVKSDANGSQVILEEGSVHFKAQDKVYQMVSGDILIYNHDMVSIHHNTETRKYDSWRKGKLVFKNQKLKDVIETLNASYNLEISLDNKALGNRKISATVNRNDPRMILQAISEIYEIELIEKSNKIILK